MSSKRHAAGFAMVEVLLIAIALVLVAAAGYFVLKYNDKNKAVPTTTQQTESGVAPSAPAVNDTSDLTEAETALDQTSVDAVASDSAELDSQLEGF